MVSMLLGKPRVTLSRRYQLQNAGLSMCGTITQSIYKQKLIQFIPPKGSTLAISDFNHAHLCWCPLCLMD